MTWSVGCGSEEHVRSRIVGMDGLSPDSLSGGAGGPSVGVADDTESDGYSILSRWEGGRLRAPWSAFAAANDGQLDAFFIDALSTDSSI